MKITKIVQQEQQKNRYSIFVEGTYVFSLSESALLESKLVTGQELSTEDLSSWKQESADDKLASAALRYAAMRLRSVWEMEQYLKRRGASPALAEKVLNKLSTLGLLNDQEFARTWIATRRLLRPSSKRKLQQELRAKHLSSGVITAAMSAERGDDRSALRAMIAKKQKISRYKAEPLKLMQYLARQGFNYEDIKSILNAPESDT